MSTGRLQRCQRCSVKKRDCSPASSRIWPPKGGAICGDCLIPATLGIPFSVTCAEESLRVGCESQKNKIVNRSDIQEILVSDTATLDAEAAEAEVPETAADSAGGDNWEDPPRETANDDEPEEESETERRPRGWLETDVKTFTDKFANGEITLEEGQFLTPHRLSRLVKEHEALDKAPSTGAVAAVLKRWVDLGFIEVNPKPFSFKAYTEVAKEKGLKAMKQERVDNRKAARAAAKPAPEEAPAEEASVE